MSDYGFVYVAANEAMPNVVKIGKTSRPPEQRMVELSGATGVPMPFFTLFYVETNACTSLERELHRCFADVRVREDREFFSFEWDGPCSEVADLRMALATAAENIEAEVYAMTVPGDRHSLMRRQEADALRIQHFEMSCQVQDLFNKFLKPHQVLK